jgi:hypothetical protein
MKQAPKLSLIAFSLFAAAVVAIGAQTSAGAMNAPNIHPQQMSTPTPAPSPT